MREIQKSNQQYLRMAVLEENDTGEMRYCQRVLQKNNIKELLQISRRCIDGEVFYYYEIEGLHSMEEVFEGAHLSKEDMKSFVQCLKDVLVSLKEFLLPQEQLYLHPGYIMYDGVSKGWRFLYLTDSYQEQGRDIVELMDFFLGNLSGDVERESWFYEYYTAVLQFGEKITPTEFVKLWKDKSEELEPEGKLEAGNEETGDFAEQFAKPILQQEGTSATETFEFTWKQKLNHICYGRLYCVPFRPDH